MEANFWAAESPGAKRYAASLAARKRPRRTRRLQRRRRALIGANFWAAESPEAKSSETLGVGLPMMARTPRWRIQDPRRWLLWTRIAKRRNEVRDGVRKTEMEQQAAAAAAQAVQQATAAGPKTDRMESLLAEIAGNTRQAAEKAPSVVVVDPEKKKAEVQQANYVDGRSVFVLGGDRNASQPLPRSLEDKVKRAEALASGSA